MIILENLGLTPWGSMEVVVVLVFSLAGGKLSSRRARAGSGKLERFEAPVELAAAGLLISTCPAGRTVTPWMPTSAPRALMGKV